MSEQPVLDPGPLHDLLDLGVGPELIQELVGLLKEDVPSRIQAVRLGFEAGDEEQVLQEAHQLKGALGNLGLLRFADLARQVEQMAREGRLQEGGPVVSAFPAAYEEALAALAEAFPGSLEA